LLKLSQRDVAAVGRVPPGHVSVVDHVNPEDVPYVVQKPVVVVRYKLDELDELDELDKLHELQVIYTKKSTS
jgi:hypothetical protein